MMLKLRPIRILCLCLWVGFSPVSGFAQVFAYTSQKTKSTENTAPQLEKLRDVLLRLKEQCKVDILFEDKLLSEVFVPVNSVKKNATFEQNLDLLLHSTGLRYKRVKKGTYVLISSRIKRQREELVIDPESVLKVEPAAPLQETVATKNTLVEEQEQFPAEIILKGKVTDKSTGEALPGVSILIKGTQKGTITNEKGAYSLIVPDEGGSLIFSFVGYLSKEVVINGQMVLNLALEVDTKGLEELVVIGYGKTTQTKNVAAVSTLKGEKLTNLPIATIGDGLAGRVPGLIVTSSGGGPGKAPVISIRGGSTPVFVIDDIISTEFDFRTLNANDIESISFLKDAAATGIYGLVAGGGVILVTTKRGAEGKMSARYDISYDLSQPTIMGDKMTGYEIALWRNEEARNAGQALPYTEEIIQKYKDQSDPLNFSSTDWQKLALKKFAPQMRQNLSLSAGNKQLQFYGSVGYFDQGTLMKFNTNSLKRYNYRMNITGNFDKIGLKTTLGIYGVSEELVIPSSQYGSGYYFIWGHIQNSGPMTPAFADLEQTKYAAGPDHPLVEMDPRSGYNRTQNRNLNGLLNIAWSVPSVKGLTVKVNGNFRQDQTWNKNWSATAPQYSAGSSVPLSQNTPNLSASAGSGYSYTVQALGGYDRTFFEKHTISALGGYEENYGYTENISASRTSYLFNIDQLFAGPNVGMQNSGTASESSRAAYLGRLKYDYDGKYLIEGSFRYDGNGNLFPKGKRWGFFPSGSVAWVISRESFMEVLDTKNVLNHFKFRFSVGTIGQNSNAGNFSYIPGYTLNAQEYVVNDVLLPGFGNPGFASPDITWFSQQSYNTGFDFGLLGNKLSGTFDYFYNRTTNYLASPSGVSYTDPLGTSLPTVNSNGAFRRAGFEFSLNYANRIGKLEYSLGANFVKFDQLWEVNPSEDSATLKNPYTRTTQELGYFGSGYHSYGYYQNTAEIMNNPTIQTSSGLLAPGDLWYEDTNGDGKIDNADLRRIGANAFPRINYGFTLDLKYQGWRLNMLWQGSGKRSVYLGDIIQTAQVYSFQQDYWTENRRNAQFPRLVGVGSNNSNNVATSDYWLIDSKYIRLKALQIGYDFKKTYLKNVNFISDFRLTLSGSNLLTFSPLNKYYMDPENGSANNYDYPSQRVYSLSLNVGF